MKFSILILAAMLVVAVPADSRPLNTIKENGHELEASMLSLPSTVGGTLAIQGCTACKRQTMTLSPDARFYVGRGEVSYDALRNFIATYPKSAVLVVTPAGKNVVTRIKLSVLITDAR